MSNEQIPSQNPATGPEEPWQGQWPGSGPVPTEGERELVENEIAQGKWSESRQRSDFTGANNEVTSDEARAREQGSAEGRLDVANLVENGTEAPS
jgi:hypothetical protein